MYKQNHQYTKAFAYQQKALEASKKNNYKKGLALAYYNLGAIVHDSSDAKPRNNDAVIAYMQQAINNAQSARDTILELQFCSVIAGMYSEVNKYDSAFLYFKKAGELIKETGTEEYFATHYLFLGLNYASTKNYKEAINDFEKGISYAKKFHKPIMEYNYYTALADAYDSLRDYKNAYLYKTKYVTLHDSLLDKEKFEMATTIENKYQQVKKDNEILKLNRDKEIAAVKRKQLIAFLFASLAGLAILAILSFLLLKNIKARKKAYAQLQEKSIQIQEQALELSKQAKLIAQFQSQMNPHFVFNALHNIQGLVMSKENEKATSQIQSLAQLMRKTFANAEKDDIPLREEISYLQKYIDFEMNSFDKQLHFEVKVGDQAEDAMIPPMMIQPFVENAIKHARLKTVQNPYIKVLIEIENNLLQISVKDNGVGIRKEETRLDNLSHSMSVIKSRIELLFQEKNKPVNENLFSIKTVPDIDTGTLVRFYLPLNYSC